MLHIFIAAHLLGRRVMCNKPFFIHYDPPKGGFFVFMGKDERLRPLLIGETGVINYVLAVSSDGPLGKIGQRLLVVGNSSAALVEGAISPAPASRYDQFDSGSQMLPFCPNGATLVVQMPEDALTPEGVMVAQSMFELAKSSLAQLGIVRDVVVEFVPNAHDFAISATLDNPTAILPLFPSTRLFGDHEAAVAAAKFNNKPNFLQLVDDLSGGGLKLCTPVTFTFNENQYPSGFPSVDDLIDLARLNGSDAIYFKQNVSAGGFGVEKAQVDDKNNAAVLYDKWLERMRKEKEKGSTEWDFHIQLGVPSPKELNGTVESPCIIAVIDTNKNGCRPRILQVAQQRLDHGTHHVGNVIDPEYERRFVSQYEFELYAVLNALAENGVRGHGGLDVVVSDSGELYFIEFNPRLNGNSRVRILRDYLPYDTVITTNNTIKLSKQNISVMEELRQYFYDPGQPDRPALAITRFPRFAGDPIGFDFINDRFGHLEEGVIRLMNSALVE